MCKDFKSTERVKASELLKMLSFISKSIKTKDNFSSGILESINLSVSESSVVFTTTDGHKLSEYTINCISQFSFVGMISFNEIQEACDYYQSECDLDCALFDLIFSDDRIRLNLYCNGDLVYASIISINASQKYPDYKKIIPADFKNEVSINKEIFLTKIWGAISLIRDDKLDLYLKEADRYLCTLEFSSITKNISIQLIISLDKKSQLLKLPPNPADFKTETIINLGINPVYLYDLISEMPGEEIVLKFNGSLNPVVCSDLQRFFMIMPVKLSESL